METTEMLRPFDCAQGRQDRDDDREERKGNRRDIPSRFALVEIAPYNSMEATGPLPRRRRRSAVATGAGQSWEPTPRRGHGGKITKRTQF